MGLDTKTAAYASSGLSSLAEQVDLARAALGDAPIYRRRGVCAPVVPRADVEIDVDIENVEDGVYLWGVLKTVWAAGTEPEYHAFVTWEPLTPEAETANSLRSWTWLTEQQREAHAAYKSFRAYRYNASAENTYLKRLGIATGTLDAVARFIQSDEWVDLLRVVDSQLITGGTVGLKAVAPLARFHWEVDDPGGGLSMLHYDAAVGAEDESAREAARSWLLTYNRGDVEATLAIRDWLEAVGENLPSIESLEAAWVGRGAYDGTDRSPSQVDGSGAVAPSPCR
jgi:predicted RecB family nuclease